MRKAGFYEEQSRENAIADNDSASSRAEILHDVSKKSIGKCLPILHVQARWIIHRNFKEKCNFNIYQGTNALSWTLLLY